MGRTQQKHGPRKRLGERLSDIYELRRQKCNDENCVFKPSVEMEKFLETQTQTIDKDITDESMRSRNEAIASIRLNKIDLAVVVRLFQLHEILATAPGNPQPRDVWRLFEKELIPDLIKWRSKFQVPSHFACFRSYVIAYLKNWCLSGVFGDHEVAVKELKETLSPEKFKDAVLKTCPDDYQQTLHRIYCLPEMQKANQKQDKAFMSALLKRVHGIKLDKQTVAIPEMRQLGLQVGKEEITALLKSIEKKMKGIQPNDRDAESEMVYSPPDEDVYTYSKDQVRKLYTACVMADALNMQGVVYHSQHEASFEVVYEVLRPLWKLYWKWDIVGKDRAQQQMYRSFCHTYTLLYLHSSQTDLVREILTLSTLHAGVFNGTASDEFRNKLKALSKCKKRKLPAVSSDPKRQKHFLDKDSVGGMLELSWERYVHVEKQLLGPMEDPDLLLMSEINSSGQSAMSGLKEWKEAHQEECDNEDTESIKRTLLELYEKKYGKPMPKPESILSLARMACKVHLLGLDEVVYGLSGTISHQLSCPLGFLFKKKLLHGISKKNARFFHFAKYYLYHSLRLEATEDLFDAKWTSDRKFISHAVIKCHPARIQEVQSLLNQDKLISKPRDPRSRRDSSGVDGF